MALYEYVNGLTGSKVKNFDNDKQNNYNIISRKDGFTLCTKDGKKLLEVDDEKNCKISVHTFDNRIAIQKNYKKNNYSNIVTFEGEEIVSNAQINGDINKIISGYEGMYFQKFDKYSGCRIYDRIYNDKDVAITPPYQVIIHEVNDNKDKFYCENYAEVSKDEFLEEDDYDFEANIVESAVYTSNGKKQFGQNYNTYGSGESSMSEVEKNYHNQMIAGAAISITNPIIGSGIMLSAIINKHKKEKKENSNEQENEPNL